MSGAFQPEHQRRIRATDDPALAAAHGLTEWDEDQGQYVAPGGGRPRVRPGEGMFFRPQATVEPVDAPLPTEPGCSHPDCVLEHPHAGPAILTTEGGEQPSPGSSSSTSSPSTAKSSESSATPRRRPARTTVSPSRQDRAENSTAPPATSSGPATRGPQATAD